MTTTNGGGRVVEHIDGQVGASNERGIKLVGEDAYRNFSKYTAEPIAPPRRGARVTLGLDAGGFVRELQVLNEAPASSSPTSIVRDREIRRMSALRSAAIFVGHYATVHEEVGTADVLSIAEAFERWLDRED